MQPTHEFQSHWSSRRKSSVESWIIPTTFVEAGLQALSRKIFTPYNILREMDLAGGTLSYEGIDVLRRVETCGIKGCRGTIIPSKSEIKRMAGIVEWYANKCCPFTLKPTAKGESIEFDFAKSMLCRTKAFYLDEIGKARSLSVASSIDGASLSKNLSIVASGVESRSSTLLPDVLQQSDPYLMIQSR